MPVPNDRFVSTEARAGVVGPESSLYKLDLLKQSYQNHSSMTSDI